MTSATTTSPEIAEPFRHEALLYAGDDGFVAGSTAFIRDGLDRHEPVLVVVVPRKIDLLRTALDGAADHVMFVDMADVGRNPARIIPVWRRFVSEHGGPGRPVRGIGEPIWAERGADELVEAQRHEALINLAFSGADAWILCPYDTEALAPDVIGEALVTHPVVSDAGVTAASATYRGPDDIARPFDRPLPPRPESGDRRAIDVDSLPDLRRLVAVRASSFGLAPDRVDDLVLAVNEVATNSVRHGGGDGELRIWQTADTLVVEITDMGRITDPLVGRHRPTGEQTSGFGMWIVNQLCDLVQVRSFERGTAIRMHMRRR